MEAIESEKDIALRCPSCDRSIALEEKFCGYCGKEIPKEEDEEQEGVFTRLSPTLVYYFITLILLSIYKLTNAFPDGIEGTVLISIIDIVIVLAFCGYYFRDLLPLFSLRRLSLGPFLLTIMGAAAGGLLVSYLGSMINVSIYDDVYYAPYMFEDTAQPFVWAIVVTCLQPAIFEEVSFRGFLYTNLQTLSPASGAIFISSFLFGVIHLSFISLLWLVPIGLAFAWLRMRYNTLWYGVVGHFAYNFTITVIDFF